VEQEKERRRRQEELIAIKNTSNFKSSDQEIVLMSQKKMLKKQGLQIFDKFTTVQEVLVHGTKGFNRPRGLLTVTTV